MLHLQNYSKSYHGQAPVLRIEELQLPHGLYWLKGENGSGKTSLLKSLAGLIPFDGTIAVAGADQSQQPKQYRKLVNYAEAEPIFPGFATGTELLHFYLRTKGGSVEKQQRLMQKLGMAPYIGNKTATYSSGMLKKLSLLLAFTGTPKLVLLDEPLTTVDTATAQTLLELIRGTYEQGVSFIITSHHPLDAQVLPFTVLKVQQQRLEQQLSHA